MMMNMNLSGTQKTFLTIISVALILVGLSAFMPKNQPKDVIDTAQASPTPVASPAPELDTLASPVQETQVDTSSWPILASAAFSFRYPEGALAESRETESYVRYMGPKQIASGRTQTELFDGYIFRVEPIPVESNAVLEQIAETERKSAIANCKTDNGKITPLKPVIIDGLNARQFSTTGCSDFTQTTLKADTIMYRITALYVGEDEDRPTYQKTTEQILSTLKFIQ